MPYSCQGCGRTFEPKGSEVGLWCPKCQPKKSKWSINCYEAYADGSLGIHIEDMNEKTAIGDGCMEIRIPANDVDRLMYGAIDALKKEPSRR